jgi:hypothetical protein
LSVTAEGDEHGHDEEKDHSEAVAGDESVVSFDAVEGDVVEAKNVEL